MFWRSLLVILLSSFNLLGCAHDKPIPKVYDEVLVFPLPMDLTYLRTLDAVQAHPDWELDVTNKEKGLIFIRNLRYSSFADADQRKATLVLKRLGPRQTSVEFAPESRTVVGGDEILALIKQYVSREVN